MIGGGGIASVALFGLLETLAPGSNGDAAVRLIPHAVESIAIVAPTPPVPTAGIPVEALPKSVRPTPVVTTTRGAIDEDALLADARRSLDATPARTLTLVAEHERDFPTSSLASDREFLRIGALVRLGRNPEANDAGRRFVARWPDSVYRAQIERLVGESP
jgi:hypothetical protein